jgi:hypothetical protein
MDREELIRRKEEVRAQIARLRRQLEALPPTRRVSHHASALEAELATLMDQERRLRLEIDRSR